MRIGLFFGSFNPMHIGHKIIASYMAEFSDLEKVLFVVSPKNPLKKKNTLIYLYTFSLVYIFLRLLKNNDFNPIKLFLEPINVSINYLDSNFNFES